MGFIKEKLFATLERRLLFWFLVLIILPVILISVIGYIQTNQIMKSAAEGKIRSISGLEIVADLQAEIIENFFESTETSLQIISRDQILKENFLKSAVQPGGKDSSAFQNTKTILDSVIIPYKLDTKVVDILLLDPDGTMIYHTNPDNQADIGNHFHPVDEVVRSEYQTIYYSDVFNTNATSSGYGMFVFALIKDTSYREIGVLVMELDMSSIYNLINKHERLGETGETLLAKRQYNSAIFLTELLKDESSALTRKVDYSTNVGLPILEATFHRDGSGISIDYAGDEVFAAWRYLDLPSNLEWGMVVKIDRAEALASISQLRNTFLILAMVIFIIGFILAFFLAKSISKPVKEIYEATKQMEVGNFKTNLDIRTGDDLQRLGESFNRTAKALGKLRTEHEELDQAKTRFMSITSHELRSPMTPMKAQLQMLNTEFYGKLTRDQKNSIELILRNTERLDKIIADFLEISRIEAARLKFVFNEVDLSSTIEGTVSYMKNFMPEKKIKFETIINKLPIIRADSDRVSQVLRNLIGNAIKFTPDGGTITVTGKKKDDFLEFSVRDTGIGITKQDQQRIFEPFFQAEQTIYRKKGGSGLGLAICRGIVLSQRGKIWLTSQPNMGTTFYFTIPLKPVLEIAPIKLLFSSGGESKGSLRKLFLETLGPVGNLEFESVTESGINREILFDYADSLSTTGILNNKEMREFKSKINILLGEGA